MKAGNKAFELIKGYEGCKLTAYQDQEGNWTIGYGATGEGIEKGVTWTQEQADKDLEARVAALAKSLTKALTGATTQGQFDAFISLAYNIGFYACITSTAFKQHNRGLYKDAAIAITWWNKITLHGVKVYSAGLNNRRLAEKAVYMDNSYALVASKMTISRVEVETSCKYDFKIS